MGALLFILLLAVPVAELWLIVQVAEGIGAVETLILLLVVSIAGAWLLKQQGMLTWRRTREALNRGEMPTSEVTDGALILLGGALLLTPGFLTDAVGLALLFPPSRAAIKAVVRAAMARRVRRRFGIPDPSRPAVHEARVVKVERTGRARTSSSADRGSGQLPSSRRPRDEDGSPDTR